MTSLVSSTAPLDALVTWQPRQPGLATFRSGIVNETGTIWMTGGSIWSPADAQRYFDDQWRVIDQARRRFGRLKILMDVRDWIVEDVGSVVQFQAINSELFRPEDRLATVVRSSSDKQNARDAVPVGIREAFVSPGAAETWLQAYSSVPANRFPGSIAA